MKRTYETPIIVAKPSVIIGVHLNHGTSINSLQLTDYNYSVS